MGEETSRAPQTLTPTLSGTPRCAFSRIAAVNPLELGRWDKELCVPGMTYSLWCPGEDAQTPALTGQQHCHPEQHGAERAAKQTGQREVTGRASSPQPGVGW